MVRGYVRGGLDEILTGSGLNHQLMALLAWAMSSVTGESEVAFRLLSVVPFVAGVVLVTAWLHRRHGALSGVLFLFLATVSPLLLDITRQARGYGLAFMAMCVVIVAALEASRTGRTWLVVGDVRGRRDRFLDASAVRDRIRRDLRRRSSRIGASDEPPSWVWSPRWR